MYNIEELRIRLLSELKEIAEELGVKNFKSLKKEDLVYAILDQQAITPEKSLPRKKPSKVESEVVPNTEAPDASPKETSAESEEKPKFRRQNVTEIPKDKKEEQEKEVKPSRPPKPSKPSKSKERPPKPEAKKS
jgi:transcription termination factor Rho